MGHAAVNGEVRSRGEAGGWREQESDALRDLVCFAPASPGHERLDEGVVVGREPDGERTPETFGTAVCAGFARLKATLEVFGLGFDDVVMVKTFPEWTAEEFGGERAAQGEAFVKVKDEAMGGAPSAWTAVGTSGLWSEAYIVEIQMIAYAPQACN